MWLYFLLHNNDGNYYVSRHEHGFVEETAQVTGPIIPDAELTVESFTDHVFYPYDAEKFVYSVEVKHYDEKWGTITDPPNYSLKFLESFFPE